MSRLLSLAFAAPFALFACGGATLGEVSADVDGGGHSSGHDEPDAFSPTDSPFHGFDSGKHDAVTEPDAGCIEPVVGEACGQFGPYSCPVAGNICCIGWVWSCEAGIWQQQGVGCACEVGEDAGDDADSGIIIPPPPPPDAGANPCGGCGDGEICVVTMSSGGACEVFPDGGICPNGQAIGPDQCCPNGSTTAACEPAPGACSKSSPPCGCAASLCECECISATETTVQCQCDYP